uniref:Glycine N-acyltransferase-like protein n=1 Tax=Acrobeloides nanus TaxID=290746 RepID=A0A914ENL7_9BILA
MCYYATEAQQQKLLDTKVVLPPGYKFAVVDFDSSDAEIINDAWEYKQENELPMTIAKLRNKPYSLIKDINNYPVAYGISTLYSLVGHRYVHPEHRHKGLAKAIDIDRAQKCIK